MAPNKRFGIFFSEKHSAFTNSRADISRKVGGKFAVFDGGLMGTNLELVQGKKIVQSWRAEMDNWPKEHYSKATFLVKKEKNGTKLSFTQASVPAECFESISQDGMTITGSQ